MFGGDKSEIEKAVFKNIENRPKSIDSSDYLEELWKYLNKWRLCE